MQAPAIRVQTVNEAPPNPHGEYVLYWMIAQRRRRYNWSLEHAVALAEQLGKPLLVLEALRIGYRWASTRLHQFAIEGMVANQRDFGDAGVRYLPYLERQAGDGKGLLAALSRRACVVVTDTYPCFFLPRMVQRAGRVLNVPLVEVDANGLFPLRASDGSKKRAVDFRRLLQKKLPEHFADMPEEDPLSGYNGGTAQVDPDVLEQWTMLTPAELQGNLTALCDTLPIDTSVRPAHITGGAHAAAEVLDRFIAHRLPGYADGRNHPDEEVASGLSSWLHYGHIGAHEVIARCFDRDGWTPASVAEKATAKREGWWGASPEVEAFLDEIVTWRELGYHFTFHHPDSYDRFDSLPQWAQKTLNEHEDDPREHTYTLDQLEAAQTHDPIWNAAQRQLVRSGQMHNYLRMLWGKKVLQWTPSRHEAIERLIELNNRYAVDGRDPNSYSGIFWVFGRFDRAWGPERPVFGKIRYMTSDSTKRKLKMSRYLDDWSA